MKLFFTGGDILDAIGRVIAIFVKILPVRTQAVLKELINPIDFMDYPDKKVRMYVDSKLQFHRLASCAKETETVKWIENCIQPGDIFYDVGANVGAYSFVAFAASEGRAKIYAFEPGFTTFAQFSRNVFLNNVQEKIIPLCIALSDETKINDFIYSDLTSGAAMHSLVGEFVEKEQHFNPVYSQPVLSFKIDDLVELFGLEVPNLMKIDVDGYEFQVLKGAEKTLMKPAIRSLLIEVDHSQMDDVRQIVEYLENKGFAIFSKHKHGSSEIYNYIFKK